MGERQVTREEVSGSVALLRPLVDAVDAAQKAVRVTGDEKEYRATVAVRDRAAVAVEQEVLRQWPTLLAAAEAVLGLNESGYEAKRARAEGDANKYGVGESAWAQYVAAHIDGQTNAERRRLGALAPKEEG